MTRKALGKGLGALIPGADGATTTAQAPQTASGSRPTAEPVAAPREVSSDRIRPNPYQPRTRFDSEALEELAQSIRENGLIQPLVVRAVRDGWFELIAGERRFKACQKAGLTEIPVVVREATRREMLEVAMVENLQREDLNPLEEAEAFQRLATEFGLTQEEIARRVGKSRTTITNSLRLLTLSDELRDMVSRGTLSPGHARALLAVPSESGRRALAKKIVDQGWSVRQAETHAQAKPKRGKAVARKRSHPALEVWEDNLRTRFGTQVRIVGGTARGRIEIQYFNEDDLERVLSLAGIETQL